HIGRGRVEPDGGYASTGMGASSRALPPFVRWWRRRRTVYSECNPVVGASQVMSPSSPSKGANALAELSAQLAGAVEASATSVVAIHARRRSPSSGIVWRDG